MIPRLVHSGYPNPDGARVLAIDDKRENLYALEKLLKDLNIEFVAAYSPNEGLAKALEQEYACILLDVRMPGMDGFEVARLLREDDETAQMPIIFLTASLRGSEDIFRGYAVGAIDYLVKPLDPSVLKSKVSAFAALYLQRRELKRLNEELKRSNDDLERFAYLVSHDLKQPLRTINTYCSMAEKASSSVLKSQDLQWISSAASAARRASETVEDILSFSRLVRDPAHIEQVNVQTIVSEVTTDLEVSIRECGAVVTTSSLPEVMSSQVHLHRIFQNLIQNALTYRKADVSPEIHVSARKEANSWFFSVKDNGIGIAREHFEKIFGFFQRLHGPDQYGGTGLGLAICKRILEIHGGAIWLESEEGVGSVFHFTIPIFPVGTAPH